MATEWELEALDPDTGEPLAHIELGGRRRRRHDRRAVNMWWAAAAFALFAVFFAYAAFYAVHAQSSLRRLERTWRTIVALDDSRHRADELLARDGDAGNEAFARRSERQVATEEMRLVESLVAELRRLHLTDKRSRQLRTAMLRGVSDLDAALDMDPIAPSARLGSVSLRLEAELHRWHLSIQPVQPRPHLPRTRSLPTELTWYSPEPTNTVLMALTGRELVTIDIDHSTTTRRPVTTSPSARLIGRLGYAVVLDQGVATAYPADPTTPPRWQMPADDVVPSRDPADVWVMKDGRIMSFPHGAGPSDVRNPPQIQLPEGQRFRGAALGGYVLSDPNGFRVEIWDPGENFREPISGRLIAVLDNGLLLDRNEQLWLQDSAGVETLGIYAPAVEQLSAAPGTPAFALTYRLTNHVVYVIRPGEVPDVIPPAGSIMSGTSVAWSSAGTWMFWISDQGWLLERSPLATVFRIRLDVPDVKAIASVG